CARLWKSSSFHAYPQRGVEGDCFPLHQGHRSSPARRHHAVRLRLRRENSSGQARSHSGDFGRERQEKSQSEASEARKILRQQFGKGTHKRKLFRVPVGKISRLEVNSKPETGFPIQEAIMRGEVRRRLLLTVTATMCLIVVARPAVAQEPFYKGKTIRLIVGLAPGGGFDTYSRVIARPIGKHIPGNPTTVVDNMPGAASLLAANYVYKAARPDGLTIGNFVGGLNLQQLLGLPGIEFDAPKFEYLGVPAQDNFMIGVAKTTGITSVEQWKVSGTVVKIGGVAPGGGTDDIPKVLKATLGLPLQLVSGYKGTGPVRLAFNAGEVQGICNSWGSFKATWRNELDTGEIVILLQANLKHHPEVPNVPWAYDLAKTDDAKKMIH